VGDLHSISPRSALARDVASNRAKRILRVSPSVPSTPADAMLNAAYHEPEQPERDGDQQHNPKNVRREP
jgi:hypothetical protein